MDSSCAFTDLPNVIEGLKVGAAIWGTVGAFAIVGKLLTVAVDKSSGRQLPPRLKKSPSEHIPYF